MQQMCTQQWFESYFIGWMFKEKICNYTYKLNFFSIDLLFQTYNGKFINLNSTGRLILTKSMRYFH